MIRREHALEYHAGDRPGKIEVRATKPCLGPREMRLAYLPGASYPAREIASDPAAAFRYTGRGNLVAVVTDGSAVPGLGAVGPAAAKPMLEGMALLFKRLADIDVFDLELSVRDADAFVETVRALEPTFGGVNLKDVRAPEGLAIHDRLRESMAIPVFHENLYGTAVVAVAALINALDLADKRVDDVRVVICGAGTVGTGCARLLRRLGVAPERMALYDIRGLVHPDRDDLRDFQREFARSGPPARLEDGVRGADILLGASTGGIFTADMIRSMARFPIVFALATPEPEIEYEVARAARRDVLTATGRGEDPNAVVDLLSFPYVLRGALDVEATRITEGMLLAAARALADLAREDVVEEVERAYGDRRFSFGPEYLLPKPIDPRIFVRESAAVARQAISEGVARRPLDAAAYEDALSVRLGTGRETFRGLMLRARKSSPRIVFSEGASDTVLRAAAILAEEGIARPTLLGTEDEIRERARGLGLELPGIAIVDPQRSPRFDGYVESYFRLRGRHGVVRATAARRVGRREYFAAMMVECGDADIMINGLEAHYADSLRVILEVIGPEPGVRRISSHYLVLLPKDALVLADCGVNVDPDAETLAETALLAARSARSLGLEPRVAMLSFSNFGSVDHPFARKVRRAVDLARERAPGLVIDGEMQLATALDGTLRREYFPFSTLDRDANVLVFPDLQSGNLALQILQHRGDAVAVGPVLMGTRLPAHVLQYGVAVEEIVHLATVGVVEAATARRPSEADSPTAVAGRDRPAV